MDIFPPDVAEASEKLASNWLKAGEFEAGLTLQLVKPLEKIKSQYGADEKNYLVQNDILEEGETFRYTFNDPSGTEKKIDSDSAPLFIGIKQCEGLGIGDWVHIVRTGKTDKTRYSVEKVDAPVSQAKDAVANTASTGDDTPNPSGIPF